MYSDLFSAESLADLQTVLPQIPFAIWETLYVTLLSTLLATVIGLPLGVLLVVGEKGGVLPLPKGVMHALNVLINLLRSIPFLILMIMVFLCILYVQDQVSCSSPRLAALRYAKMKPSRSPSITASTLPVS